MSTLTNQNFDVFVLTWFQIPSSWCLGTRTKKVTIKPKNDKEFVHAATTSSGRQMTNFFVSLIVQKKLMCHHHSNCLSETNSLQIKFIVTSLWNNKLFRRCWWYDERICFCRWSTRSSSWLLHKCTFQFSKKICHNNGKSKKTI